MRKYILIILLSISACIPHSHRYIKKAIKPRHHVSIKKEITTHILLTCYQPVVSQCDGDPLTTSDGSKINLSHLRSNKIRWCAISQDLLYLFPKGQKRLIWIEGHGIYEVRDVMNRRLRHRVDLLIHPRNSFRIKKDNVKIKIIL